jgi:hypothetical protein
MSKERKPDAGTPVVDAAATADENFLARWSRRKSRDRDGLEEDAGSLETIQENDSDEALGTGPQPDQPDETDPDVADVPGDEDMPPIEELGDDSDYSAFFSPGVSPGLRKKALARLFHSPKFNIRDGLDDYDDDYTTYKPLGNIVTAEMRRRAEDLLRRQMEAEEMAVDDAPDSDDRTGETMTARSDDPDSGESDGTSDSADIEKERENDA